MQLFIYTTMQQPTPITPFEIETTLVRAELTSDADEYRVWHPVNGYSVWPADQFENYHRPLTRRELQLVNHSMAELEVMSISDPSPEYLMAVGKMMDEQPVPEANRELHLPDGRVFRTDGDGNASEVTADQWPEEARDPERLPPDGNYVYNLLTGRIRMPDGSEI
ncbi:MAG: hypothetical protein ACR2PR_08105 [Pseudohongiellaceae bacterium]